MARLGDFFHATHCRLQRDLQHACTHAHSHTHTFRSLYPTWDGGATMASIAELSTLADLFPTKKIYIAETSYPAQGDQQPEAEYEVRLSSISSHNLC